MAARKTLTGANIVIALTVAGLFDAPQQLQGFATDDIFSTNPLASAEVLMGVDGYLSAGFVFVPIEQHFNLQADSDSIDFFDQWQQAQQVAQDLYFADGVVMLPSLRKKWSMTKGVLTSYPVMPDVGKTSKPRRFTIVWEKVFPSPV